MIKLIVHTVFIAAIFLLNPVYAKSLGVWIYKDSNYTAQVEIISSEKESIVITRYSDGSKNSENLLVKKIGNEKRYYEEGNRFGEYYVINKNGNLNIYDAEGLIFEASKK